jgi:hypothetical protein
MTWLGVLSPTSGPCLPRKAKVSSIQPCQKLYSFMMVGWQRNARLMNHFPYLEMWLVFPGCGFLCSQIGVEIRFHLDVGPTAGVVGSSDVSLMLLTRMVAGEEGRMECSGFGTVAGVVVIKHR